ncbi:MAG: hypothetical protein GTO18_10390 [Anaerolineales bacterium]|nr:hypothetical protein [Anaerolineales bacterium]
MSQGESYLETRDVHDFNQVVLRGSLCGAELIIEQGDRESLTIRAEPSVAHRIETGVRDRKLMIRLGGSWLERLGDLLTSDLMRPNIRCVLQVRELQGLDLYCAANVHAQSVKTDSLHITWRGAGNLVISSLETQNLEVKHSGVGMIEIAGQTEVQRVRLSGVGKYNASQLRTKQTEVRVTGSSVARVQASGALDAVVSGIGIVEYSGNPRVRTRIAGAGNVVRA